MCRQITLSAIHKKISSKEIQKRRNIAMSAAEPPNDQFLTVNLAFFLNKGSAPFVCPLNNIPTCCYGKQKAFLTLSLFYYLLSPRIISINRCLSYISFPFLGNIVYYFLVIAPLAEWTVKDLWDFACDMLVYLPVSHESSCIYYDFKQVFITYIRRKSL